MYLVPAKPQRRYCICGPEKLNICGQFKIQHKTLICDGKYPETAWRQCKLHKLSKASSFTRLGWKGLFTFLHTAAHSWQALLGEKGLPGTPATYLRGPSALWLTPSHLIKLHVIQEPFPCPSYIKKTIFSPPCFSLSLLPYFSFYSTSHYLSCIYLPICFSVLQEC